MPAAAVQRRLGGMVARTGTPAAKQGEMHDGFLHPQGRTMAGLRNLTGDLEMKAGDPKKASADYLIVVQFHDDKEFKPLALWKAAKAFDELGDTAEAEKYRRQLKREFPDWEAP